MVFVSAALAFIDLRLGNVTRRVYYVYILLCVDGSYYTGYSNNPSQRLVEHLNGRGARYTRMHTPTRIVYLQRHNTQRQAMLREREIKGLTHEAKRRLIAANTLATR